MTTTKNEEKQEMMTEFMNYICLDDDLFWHKYDSDKISAFLDDLIKELEEINPKNNNKTG